jgi:hypothetical protein
MEVPLPANALIGSAETKPTQANNQRTKAIKVCMMDGIVVEEGVYFRAERWRRT